MSPPMGPDDHVVEFRAWAIQPALVVVMANAAMSKVYRYQVASFVDNSPGVSMLLAVGGKKTNCDTKSTPL